MRKLTKQDILEGTNKKVNLDIKEYGAGVVIRPLDDGEISRIFSIVGPVPISADGTPDTSKVELHKNFEALRLATEMGLVEPKLNSKEVANMKFGVPEYIGARVLELSGVSPPELIKKKGAR